MLLSLPGIDDLCVPVPLPTQMLTATVTVSQEFSFQGYVASGAYMGAAPASAGKAGISQAASWLVWKAVTNMLTATKMRMTDMIMPAILLLFSIALKNRLTAFKSPRRIESSSPKRAFMPLAPARNRGSAIVGTLLSAGFTGYR